MILLTPLTIAHSTELHAQSKPVSLQVEVSVSPTTTAPSRLRVASQTFVPQGQTLEASVTTVRTVLSRALRASITLVSLPPTDAAQTTTSALPRLKLASLLDAVPRLLQEVSVTH